MPSLPRLVLTLTLATVAVWWATGEAAHLEGGAPDRDLSPQQVVPVPPWLEGLVLEPTYAGGAGLVFAHRCTGCHRPAAFAPMSFLTYEDIRRRAVGTQTPMKDAVALRMMPPWPPDPAIGRFANDPRLSSPELSLLEEWIESGYPHGEGEYEPEGLWSGEWTIGTPDVVFDLPEHTVAAELEGEVVEFVVRTEFPDDRWVVAAEVVPGDRSIVLAVDAGPLGSYRPGNPWVRHLTGTGKRLLAGSSVTVRVQYRKDPGYEEVDRTRLGVIFSDAAGSVSTTLLDDAMIGPDFQLEAGQEDLEVRARFVFPEAGRIHSLMPTMHDRGARVEYSATFPDGHAERLLSLPSWDAKWKLRYQLATPLPVPAGTVVEAVAHFDNSMRNLRNNDPWSPVGSGPLGETFEGWLEYSLGPT